MQVEAHDLGSPGRSSDFISGYGRTGGWKSTAENLSSIFDGMEKNGLLSPSRLLTGMSVSTGQFSRRMLL
jgi:hypothetical protein